VQQPWTWPGTKVVPGGILMSLAAAAAYKTVSTDFVIDTLQAHFLSGPKAELPLLLRVQQLSNGGRFATRVITVEQAEAAMVHVTCSFVRIGALGGPSMEHDTGRASEQTVEKITLDDLEPRRGRLGPYMKFQRLPLAYNGGGTIPKKPSPESMVYTSVAQISPPMETYSRQLHTLGIICLSDYHVLDAAPTLHGLTFGLPEIGDTTRTRTESLLERYTTLNHTLHFHSHDGFKADDLCYIEVTSPWSGKRRAEMQTRIFGWTGRLIATCVQEAYYVLKDKRGSKI
jgi:acyl-CoA thioesterase